MYKCNGVDGRSVTRSTSTRKNVCERSEGESRGKRAKEEREGERESITRNFAWVYRVRSVSTAVGRDYRAGGRRESKQRLSCIDEPR